MADSEDSVPYASGNTGDSWSQYGNSNFEAEGDSNSVPGMKGEKMETENSNDMSAQPNGAEMSAINEETSASANSPWKPAPDDGSNPSQPTEVKEEHAAESRKRSRFDIPPDTVKSFGFDLKAAVEEAKRLKMGNGIKKEEEIKKEDKKKKEKEGPVHKQSKLLPDLDKHWKIVDENPRDFNAWTTLLQYVDQENDLEVAREAYDSFLARYPYCYGYWKKYADYEKKKGHKKDCEQVFERGLAAIPLSVDLWLHYLNYCRVHHAAREDYVRQQFDRAVDTCGLEFRSDRIWELYINWEVERDDLGRVFRIYDRLLKIPTQFHSTHFDNFEDLVTQNDPKELLSPEEYETIKQEVVRRRQDKDDEGGDGKRDLDEDGKLSDEEMSKMKEIIKTMRRATHRKTEAAIAERWSYEEAIKRPYFHVKPLERGQLKNWRSYTDFEISKGNKERIVILFERCLIACALYEEFWLKYVNYLESLPKSDETQNRIRDVFRRACTIHLQDKPNIHLHWAAYEEKTGNVSVASEILEQLEKKHPNLGIVPVRRIHVLRRGHFGHPAVLALFHSYLDKDKEELPGDVRADIAVRAARYATKVLGDHSLASQFLFKALDKESANPRLYLQLVDLEYQKLPMEQEAVVEALDRGILAPLDAEERYKFAQRKVEFLEEFGTSLDLVWTAQEELAQLKKVADEARAAKLAAEGKTEEGPDTKKAKIEDKTATAAAVAADPSAAAGAYDQSQYGQYYQQYGQWGYGGQGYQQNWQGYYPQQQY